MMIPSITPRPTDIEIPTIQKDLSRICKRNANNQKDLPIITRHPIYLARSGNYAYYKRHQETEPSPIGSFVPLQYSPYCQNHYHCEDRSLYFTIC